VANNVHKNEKIKINHKIGRRERLVKCRIRCDPMINICFEVTGCDILHCILIPTGPCVEDITKHGDCLFILYL